MFPYAHFLAYFSTHSQLLENTDLLVLKFTHVGKCSQPSDTD